MWQLHRDVTHPHPPAPELRRVNLVRISGPRRSARSLIILAEVRTALLQRESEIYAEKLRAAERRGRLVAAAVTHDRGSQVRRGLAAGGRWICGSHLCPPCPTRSSGFGCICLIAASLIPRASTIVPGGPLATRRTAERQAGCARFKFYPTDRRAPIEAYCAVFSGSRTPQITPSTTKGVTRGMPT